MIHTRDIFTCCFAAAALLGVPSLAHANTSPSPSTTPLTFEWLRGRGAESCPDADQVASEIEAKAGRTVFSAAAAHKIEVLITRTGDVWTARIEERDAMYRPALLDGKRPAFGEGIASSRSALGWRPDDGQATTSAVLVTTPGRS